MQGVHCLEGEALDAACASARGERNVRPRGGGNAAGDCEEGAFSDDGSGGGLPDASEDETAAVMDVLDNWLVAAKRS